jgi:hypothetical protein
MPSFEFLIGHFLLEEGADENAIAVAAFYPSYWWHWLNYLLGVFCGIKVFFYIHPKQRPSYVPPKTKFNKSISSLGFGIVIGFLFNLGFLLWHQFLSGHPS